MKTIHITYFVYGTTTDNEKGLSSGWEYEFGELASAWKMSEE